MEVHMKKAEKAGTVKKLGNEQIIRNIVLSRTETKKTLIVNCHFKHFTKRGTRLLDICFILEWWAQYRVYRAFPIDSIGTGFTTWHYCALIIPPEWYKVVKYHLRSNFQIHHVHGINQKDNSKRIDDLMGVQVIPDQFVMV